MSIIHYAISIDTEVTGTNEPTIGLTTDGFMRFITDRPDYDGTPTYPLWEDDSNNTHVWYEGFLITEKFSNPYRGVDIEKGGNYGTISNFTFAIHNAMKLWKELQTLEIVLTNANVVVYCVIDDKFYTIWSGMVENDPYTETTTLIKCTADKSKKIHKTLPPNQINNVLFPKARKSSYGKTIPICFGNIPYAQLFSTSAIDTRMVLDYGLGQYHPGIQGVDDSDFIYSVAATNYDYSALDSIKLKIITRKISYEVDHFLDKFLSVVSGENAETEKLIQIISSSASVLKYSGGTPNNYYYETTLYLSSFLSVTDTVFNSDYIFEFHSATSPKSGVDQTWWFNIYDGNSQHLFSNEECQGIKKNDYNQYQIYNYNKDTNLYEDVYGMFTKLTSYHGRRYINLLTSQIEKDGTIEYLTPYGCDFSMSEIDFFLLIDLISKENAVDFSNFTQTGNILPSTITVNDLPTAPKKLTERCFNIGFDSFDLKSITDLYLGIDIYVTIAAEPSNYYFGVGIEFLYVDQYGFTQHLTNNIGVDYTYEKLILKDFVSNTSFNFFPNEYYKSNTAGLVYDDSIYTNIDDDGNKVRDYIKIPDELKELLIKKVAKRILVCLTFSTQNGLKTTTQSVEVTSITVRQIGLFGYQETNTEDDSLFVRIEGGEKVNMAGDPSTSVFSTTRHILNNYDGINYSDIDFDNIPTERDISAGWEVGRQITEQKSSMDYLKDLCQYSFMAIFPKRTGNLRTTAFIENTTLTSTFNESNIIKNSISKFNKTSILNCFNSFKLSYSYNPASKKFDRNLGINHVEESSFPDVHDSVDGAASEITSLTIVSGVMHGDGTGNIEYSTNPNTEFAVDDFVSIYCYYTGTTTQTGDYVYFAKISSMDSTTIYFDNAIISKSIITDFDFEDALVYLHQDGIPKWMTYVEGIDSYASSKVLWTHCHNSYLKTKTKRNAPDNITKSKWFIDRSLYDNDETSIIPIDSAPYQYLEKLVEWTSRQKNTVEFRIPITTTFLIHELLDYINFSDTILTDGATLTGWINKIGFDMRKHEMIIGLILLPLDYEELGYIIETGSAPNTITESGSQADTITEGE